jgi:hypothetical protein
VTIARIWLSCYSLLIHTALPYLPRLWRARLCLLLGLVLLTVSGLSACNDDVTDPDDVMSDAERRVEETLLPVLTDESEVVLRYLLNILAALPEICATPLAELGSFTSSLPALQRAQQQVGDTPTLDEDDGSWEVTWRDAVLGDDEAPLTVDTDTPSVNLTLTIFFRASNFATLVAVPFTLAPPAVVQTVADPPTCATVTNEGFFLVQDAVTGEWTLSWCALGETKVFEGEITAQAISRLIRRRSTDAQSVVTSLTINDATTSVSFNESTAPSDDKGFRFFVRPGERVRFRLRIGATASSLEEITSEQIRLGLLQPLPADLDPDDFSLASNVPIDPRGDPLLTPGTDLGTFIWQDVENNQCTPGQEDQWRLRFSTRANATVFSGTVNTLDDDNDARLRATSVGACPDEAVQGATEFDYTCTAQDETESGYDICVTTGGRVGFDSEVDDVPDPGRVFLGAQRASPPSPDPFTILFNIELEEQQSSRDVRFDEDEDEDEDEDTDEGEVVLRGNNDEEGTFQLNPDQVSLDPLCRFARKNVQPPVRFTGEGEYATERFEGSQYVLDDDDDYVEFTTANVDSLADTRRFPDRGKVLLRTRLNNEDAEITAPMADIRDRDGRVSVPIDVELNVDDVMFRFPDQEVDLTVE